LTSGANNFMLTVLYAIARPSVCTSVRLSHGWISQQEAKLSLG